MIRRLIVRGLAVTLLAVCVVAWVGSYFRWGKIRRFQGLDMWHLEVCNGVVHFGDIYMLDAMPVVWDWRMRQPDRDVVRMWYSGCDFGGAGFAYVRMKGISTMGRVVVPLWFPTVLAAGAVCLLWRRTRGPGEGSGFPVEFDAKKGVAS
jgi:hypothetical protein